MTASHFEMTGRCPVHNVASVQVVRELPRQMAGHCPYCWRRVTWPADSAIEGPSAIRINHGPRAVDRVQ